MIDIESESARIVCEKIGLDIVSKGEIDEKVAFETFNDKIITGDSLYKFDGYKFIEDFKERVDTYDPNLGIVYADDDPEHKGNHLDQELLISDIGENGEAAPFSTYGLLTSMLSSGFEGKKYLEEVSKDGQLFIRFKKPYIQKIFFERRQMLIDGYANLLAIENLLKKLSPIYETDMAEAVSGRVKHLCELIEAFNKALRFASDPDKESKKTIGLLRQKALQFEGELFIDIDSIEPNQQIIADREVALKEIFPRIMETN